MMNLWMLAASVCLAVLPRRSPSSATESGESVTGDKVNLEGAQALLAYLDRNLDRERERYKWAEEKTSRYVQVVAFIVAGGVAAAPTAQRAMERWNEPVFAMFLLGYALALLGSIVCVLFAALVSGVQTTATMPVDEGTVTTFIEAPLHETARAAAVTYRGCIEKYQVVSEGRFRAVMLAYRGALVAVAGALVALLVYLFMPPS